MADSLIDLIKVLRDRTGAGLMDCKGALLANDCDLDKASDWLREKGLAKALANIPSREEIYAKMLGCINSPASGIANSINAVMSQLTRTMAAVRDQKTA